MREKIAIIGGGISGVSLARMLSSEADVTVFEQKKSLGGLIGCHTVNGYLYHTIGGHVFNSKNEKVLEWFWQFFNREEEFINTKRAAQIFIDDQYIGYPIEDNLYKLGDKLIADVVTDLLSIEPEKKAENFEQFLKNNFGNTLYELYFRPYNEKVWDTDLSLIPIEWLSGKLPMPDVREIMINNILRKEEEKMVHASFYYPKQNGSQFIIDRLAQGLNFVTGVQVTDINIDEKGQLFINNNGPFDKVVYTGDVRKIPSGLPEGYISAQLIAEIAKIHSNGTSNVLCACDKNDLTWLYLPEKKFKAHRIIYTGNLSNNNNRDNSRSSCVVEFSNFLSESEAREQIKALPGNLEFISYNHEPYTYIIQEKDTRRIITETKAALKKQNIYLLGRFAEWEYYNMDKAIEAAFVLKEELLNQ